MYKNTGFSKIHLSIHLKKCADQEKRIPRFNNNSFMTKALEIKIMHRYNPLFTMISNLFQTLQLLVFLNELSYTNYKKVKNLILGVVVFKETRTGKVSPTMSY